MLAKLATCEKKNNKKIHTIRVTVWLEDESHIGILRIRFIFSSLFKTWVHSENNCRGNELGYFRAETCQLQSSSKPKIGPTWDCKLLEEPI